MVTIVWLATLQRILIVMSQQKIAGHSHVHWQISLDMFNGIVYHSIYRCHYTRGTPKTMPNSDLSHKIGRETAVLRDQAVGAEPLGWRPGTSPLGAGHFFWI